MKTIATLLTILLTTAGSHAVGLVNFANSSSTLISVDGAPMPTQTEREFIFAVFLAPSSTVSSSGLTAAFADPVFQLACGYTTNHSSPLGAGRLTSRPSLDAGSIAGYSAGEFVDFVVRGWSSNLGYTWSEALANWNNGNPLVADWAIGSSTIGNDLLLGGNVFPQPTLFGIGPDQVGGFNFQVGGFNLIPEPSSLTLAASGLALLMQCRRRVNGG